MAHTTYESVLREARQLTPEERRRLRDALALVDMQQSSVPRESLYGIAAAFGPAPSGEEIDATQREIWADFTRDDI